MKKVVFVLIALVVAMTALAGCSPPVGNVEREFSAPSAPSALEEISSDDVGTIEEKTTKAENNSGVTIRYSSEDGALNGVFTGEITFLGDGGWGPDHAIFTIPGVLTLDDGTQLSSPHNYGGEGEDGIGDYKVSRLEGRVYRSFLTTDPWDWNDKSWAAHWNLSIQYSPTGYDRNYYFLYPRLESDQERLEFQRKVVSAFEEWVKQGEPGPSWAN